MRSTLRPQNKCGSCGHTWHPRGTDQSPKCPACGSRSTRIVAPSLIASAVAGLIFLWAISTRDNHQAPDASVAPETNDSLPADASNELASSPTPATLCERAELRYPREALRDGQQGQAVVLLTWNAAGEIVNVVLQTSTGSRELDRAALSTARRSRACPGTEGQGLLALDFVLNDEGSGELTEADKAHTPDAEAQRLDLNQLPDGVFLHPATLTDFKGSVVVQSKASLLGENVAVLSAGTRVLASAKEGKWIMVKTSEGHVGYVRGRQLDFGTSSDSGSSDVPL